MFRSLRLPGLIVLIGAFLLPACASLPTREALPAHPGFDTWQYPGEAAMRAWRAASPYQWVGYYLPAPCHRDASWAGTRPALERMGYGIAALYVGQQVFEADTTAPDPARPIVCSRTLLNEAQGLTDGNDAAAKMQAEGFAAGSVVFLDVERVSRIPPALTAYVRAWTQAVLADGRFTPGLYAHRINAAALTETMQAATTQSGRLAPVPLWVAGGVGFGLDQRPTASGFAATVWQGALDVTRTWGSVTLRVDENVATSRNPSAPARPVPTGTW